MITNDDINSYDDKQLKWNKIYGKGKESVL